MKKALYIFLIFQFSICIFQFASAQCTVKGVLFDEKNGEAVPFANVVLFQGDQQTIHGCATDINGFFMINRVPAGTYTLKVRFIGYEEYTETITVANGKTLTKSIRLKPSSKMLEAVEIKDKRFLVGIASHPEFKSHPDEAHPLYQALIAAAL